jgi:hypothetical protein
MNISFEQPLGLLGSAFGNSTFPNPHPNNPIYHLLVASNYALFAAWVYSMRFRFYFFSFVLFCTSAVSFVYHLCGAHNVCIANYFLLEMTDHTLASTSPFAVAAGVVNYVGLLSHDLASLYISLGFIVNLFIVLNRNEPHQVPLSQSLFVLCYSLFIIIVPVFHIASRYKISERLDDLLVPFPRGDASHVSSSYPLLQTRLATAQDFKQDAQKAQAVSSDDTSSHECLSIQLDSNDDLSVTLPTISSNYYYSSHHGSKHHSSSDYGEDQDYEEGHFDMKQDMFRSERIGNDDKEYHHKHVDEHRQAEHPHAIAVHYLDTRIFRIKKRARRISKLDISLSVAFTVIGFVLFFFLSDDADPFCLTLACTVSHSLWHIFVALGIVFLLKAMRFTDEELDSNGESFLVWESKGSLHATESCLPGSYRALHRAAFFVSK